MTLTCSNESLAKMAERLRLTFCRDHMEEILFAATNSKMNPREVMEYVLRHEVERREVHRIKLAAMSAHFPRKCTLDEFDCSVQPSIDEAVIRELKTLQWIEKGSNLLLLGPPGVGKTHLAIAFGLLAIDQGYSVLFKTAESLVKDLIDANKSGKLEQKLLKLSKIKLLIIDEFGYLPFSAEGSHLLFQLINRRYEQKSTVITSNRVVRDWGIILGDPTAASAILDRLLHHCNVMTINGESYRMMSVKKNALLQNNNN